MGKLATDPIDNIQPLLLVKDPHGGQHSGGKWLAFRKTALSDSDMQLLMRRRFADYGWRADSVTERAIGKGDCPVLAAQDLGRKLEALNGEG